MAVQKCYYCANPLNDEDMVIKPIPLKTKRGCRNYKRKFHIDCLPKYLKEHKDIKFKEQEKSDWDQVYGRSLIHISSPRDRTRSRMQSSA